MKLTSYFKHFLENTANLNQSRIDDLDQRVEAITNYLAAECGAMLIEVIPQGSYAHKTIIKPVKGRDFDADVLLHLEEQAAWEPKDYIAEVYKAFRRSSPYKELVGRKTRSVTVDYADDFHIDVVPYVERIGGKYVTNRDENRFELTNPEGFNDWLDDQNRIASNHLVEVIRLVKYLRDSKGTFSVKSVILTTLLGKRVNHTRVWGDPDYYADMPTTLYRVLRDLDTELQANPMLPRIEDPSCPSEDFNHRWDEEGYSNFREKLHYYSGKVTAAYEEPDQAKSLAIWQEVFGPSFEAPQKRLARSATLPALPETEQWLERDLGFPTTPTRFRLRIKGNVLPKNGFRHGLLSSRGNRVAKGRRLRFTVEVCDVPKPYEVYWKVKNTGEEAAMVGQLRGEITRDKGFERREESTLYRGSHYVECYIVKDGVCVALDKQLVFVR